VNKLSFFGSGRHDGHSKTKKKCKTGHKTNKTMKQKRGLENQCKICLKLGKAKTACGIVHMKLHRYYLSSIVLLSVIYTAWKISTKYFLQGHQLHIHETVLLKVTGMCEN